MKKFALAALAALLIAGSAGAQDNGTMMKSSGADNDSGAMMKAVSSTYDLAGLGKQVVAFTTEAAAQALAKTQTVVYYFAATWCPDCQATYKDLKANFAKIPRNLTIVFVNYDKTPDLKKKYGITMQHTFVVVGPQGEKKKVWSGSTTVAELVKTASKM